MKIKEAIIVEGIYDKIKLDSIIDAVVVTTDGFRIFKDKEKREYIKKLAQKRGIVLFTDPDRAGFLIRNHLKGLLSEGEIKQAFIPDIAGKEKRKQKASKEGLLGVEGVDKEEIINALRSAGCTIDGESLPRPEKKVDMTDFYRDGFSGRDDSRERRNCLARRLGLPVRISSHALIDAINVLYGYQEYVKIRDEINGK